MSKTKTSALEVYAGGNSLLHLIGGFIRVAIEMIKSIVNEYVSNNYLYRCGTKGMQEKTRKISGYNTIIKKQKSFNKLCHYKRQSFSYLRSWKT